MEPRAGGIITAIDSMIPGGIPNLFNLGLGAGAILALGTIIYAGILYSVAGDSESKQKEAKAWILAAVKGLALLAFGVVLINIVNPGLMRTEETVMRELEPLGIPDQQLREEHRRIRIRVPGGVTPEDPIIAPGIADDLRDVFR